MKLGTKAARAAFLSQVRGVLGNRHPYRDLSPLSLVTSFCHMFTANKKELNHSRA